MKNYHNKKAHDKKTHDKKAHNKKAHDKKVQKARDNKKARVEWVRCGTTKLTLQEFAKE